MTAVVLDPSMPIRAFAASQFLEPALRLMESDLDFFAPTMLQQEVYNAVFGLERRRRLTHAEADTVLVRLDSEPIVYSWDPDWLPRAREIALRFRQPNIFDAIYLVCADDLGCDLWTCDRKFVASFGALRPANLRLCRDDVEAAPTG